MAFIFCEMSNPTKHVIREISDGATGQHRRIGALSADPAPTAIIGCQQMTSQFTVRTPQGSPRRSA
jgi:hypothetical protein